MHDGWTLQPERPLVGVKGGLTEEVAQASASARLVMTLRRRLKFVTTGLLGDYRLLELAHDRIVELEKRVTKLETT